ncbi:MAG: sensor histidine kinase [Saprospiraceae bacterium]|nr:sensor histidine kinase [Candidatus Defluviibacterium haderslevense]
MSKEIAETNKDKETPVRFKPRARLLLQLGDQLIKNESIALVELVKNSYDADANVVTIYMENVDDLKNGIIIIEDDGYGMSADTVENVWLEPGSDIKTQKIKKLEVSPKYERLPIGEKGIGRFGVHKLGNVIEMTTKSADSKEVYVKIDWTDFDNHKYLEDVPITIIERTTPRIFKNGKTGTKILISDLRKKWERGIAREVKRSITALASPFDVNDSFKPSYTVLDKPGWFEGLLNWKDVKDYSLFRFKITMEGSSINEFSYDFTPWASMTKLFPRAVRIEDLLIDQFKTLKYVEDTGDKKIGDIINLGKYKIGSVTFEGYIFDRDPFVLKLGVSDKTGFKKYLDTNGGVKVFRDKLRVYDYGEPENDWLGLDLRRVNQPTKRVSNNILLSAISINRKESSDLIEKTNREGFLENEAYEAFRGAILHSLEIIETLRYQDKQKVRVKYGPTPKSSPVMSTLSEAKNYAERKVKPDDVREQIIKYFTKIESDYKTISNNLLKAAGAGLSMSVVIHEVEKIIYEVEKVLKSEKASERVLSLVKHLSSLIDGYAEIIRKSSQTAENISQVIDQALFNTEFRLASHKIEILKEYKNFKGKSKIKVAKNLVIGTIMNLVDNSIFWLDQRGFKAIENKEKFSKKLFVNLVEEDKYLNLVIADNGTGFLIPTDDITEPFITAKPSGIGLGLHIANEIMEAQHGRIIFPDTGDFELPNEFKKGATIVLAFKK